VWKLLRDARRWKAAHGGATTTVWRMVWRMQRSSSAAVAVQMAREDEEWRGAAMAAGAGRRRLNYGGRT